MVESMILPEELEHLRQASLSSGITPGEGAELFARILAADMPQVIIPPFAPGSLASVERVSEPQPRRRESSRPAPLPEKRPTTPPNPRTAPPSVQRPIAPAPVAYSAGTTELDGIAELLVSRLADIWSSLLGVRNIAPSDNFYELGGQSLMALQIVSRVREQFSVELTLSDLLENPILSRFGTLVQDRLVDGIAAMPDEQVRQVLASGEGNGSLR
jgi:acyl carrier protein